jgi:hypothetical protein
MAVNDYGSGRFIYHSEFSPLVGYSGYVVDNFEYGFFRKAIDQAFATNGAPLVRLSGWPYPYNAAFKTRHDHFLSLAATDIEAAYGVQGEWLPRTNAAIGGPDWEHLSDILANGALIGSHTLDEYTLDSGDYSAAYSNIDQSLNDLATHLGSRPEIFATPGMCAMRDTSLQAIVDNGIKTTGDMSHGPYPNFALKIDTATDYGSNAHWPLLELPVSRYYAPPGAAWSNLIYSHMGDMTIPVIEKTVDLTYDLGGLINIYAHIADSSLWTHPNMDPFEHYIAYSLAKPYVWNTNPLEIHDWWSKRDSVSIAPSVSHPAPDQTQVDVTVSGSSDLGPFALDIAIPAGSGVHQVLVDGNPVTGYRVEGQKLKVSVPVPAQVEVLFGTPLPLTCYALTLGHTGQGSDPVATLANSTGCSAGEYVAGEIITLSGATPDAGWQIDSWSGTNNDASQMSINTVTMPASAHATSVIYTATQTIFIHSIALEAGWNLISFNLQPVDTNIEEVLSSIAGNYDLVYAWDATGAHAGSGNWMKHDNIPLTADTLTTLDETMGFWIHMLTADTLDVMGYQPTTTDIALTDDVGGWNLVAYPSSFTNVLPDVMSNHGAGTDFSLVYAYHAADTADTWKLFDLAAPPFANDLTEMAPGWGYWVMVSADNTWSVEYSTP